MATADCDDRRRPDPLLDTFGTTEPTQAQVEASKLAVAEELHWRAVYFAVYQDGSPVAWACFAVPLGGASEAARLTNRMALESPQAQRCM